MLKFLSLRMRRTVMSKRPLLIVSYLAIVIMAFVPQTAHSLPAEQGKCSESEVQVQGTDVAVLNDVTVETPQLATPGEQCKVIFSTEAATSEPDTQLLILTYAFSFPGEPPPSFLCLGLPGPVLTRVPDGFDETTTFMSIYTNSFSPHGTLTLTPCISSAFGGQFRLRRHCLAVECQTK
jgi:hypothetical protein